MPQLVCRTCGRQGRLLPDSSKNSSVQYFRCDRCSQVWLHHKSDPHGPPVPVTILSDEPKAQHVRTGIVCHKCQRAIVQIESETPDAHFVFRCPGCGHRWSTEDSGPPKPQEAVVTANTPAAVAPSPASKESCPRCGQPGRLRPPVTPNDAVDYYQCDSCGRIWWQGRTGQDSAQRATPRTKC